MENKTKSPSNHECVSHNGSGLIIYPLRLFLETPVILSKRVYFQNDNSLFNNEELTDLLRIIFTAFLLLSSSSMCNQSTESFHCM